MYEQKTCYFTRNNADNIPQSELDEAPIKMPQSRVGTADAPPQAYGQLIARSRHTIQTSKDFASFREHLNAEITSIQELKGFHNIISHASMIDSTYNESVEFAARSFLLSLTRYAALFFANAQLGGEFAKRLCAVVALNINAIESEIMDYYCSRPEGVAGALIEILRLEIQRIQNDVQEAVKELTQALDSFAKSPGTKQREFVVTTFLRALYDAESNARKACRRYEYAEIMSQIAGAHVIFYSSLSSLCELDLYNPRDFPSLYRFKPRALNQHFYKFSENEKFDRVIEETLSTGAIWMVLDQNTIEIFDCYLRSEAQDDKIHF